MTIADKLKKLTTSLKKEIVIDTTSIEKAKQHIERMKKLAKTPIN